MCSTILRACLKLVADRHGCYWERKNNWLQTLDVVPPLSSVSTEWFHKRSSLALDTKSYISIWGQVFSSTFLTEYISSTTSRQVYIWIISLRFQNTNSWTTKGVLFCYLVNLGYCFMCIRLSQSRRRNCYLLFSTALQLWWWMCGCFNRITPHL